MTKVSDILQYADILVHTDDILVVQTHAGEYLPSPFDAHSTNSQIMENLNDVSQSTTAVDFSITRDANSFGSYNLGLHVHDNPQQVLYNRADLLIRINHYLAKHHDTNAQIDSIYWLNQIHSNHVVTIDTDKPNAVTSIGCKDNNHNANSESNVNSENSANNDNSDSNISCHSRLSLMPPSADALITQRLHTALAIMTADCVPIVLYDAKSGQIAAIHAGWQGLANGVIASTFSQLTAHSQFRSHAQCTTDAQSTVYHPADSEAYQSSNDSDNNDQNHYDLNHCDPNRNQDAPPCQAWIGACISQPNYEVSCEVVEKLLLSCTTMGMDYDTVKTQIVAAHDNPNKAWLDLPKLAEMQLSRLGIVVNDNASTVCGGGSEGDERSDSETKAHGCSYADSRYYSYRRMTHLNGQHTGRMAMLVMRRLR